MRQLTQKEAIDLASSEGLMKLAPTDRANFQLRQQRLCMNFGQFQLDVETLLGRPVWTHEFANPDRLIAEAEGRLPTPNFNDILAQLSVPVLLAGDTSN